MKTHNDKALLDEIALLLRQVELLERLNNLSLSLNSVVPHNGTSLAISGDYAYVNKVYNEIEFNSNPLCDPNSSAINNRNEPLDNLEKAKRLFVDVQRSKLLKEILLTLGFQPKT
jgi:hypothetical protein